MRMSRFPLILGGGLGSACALLMVVNGVVFVANTEVHTG
jgi:hypothetical protein